jgi:thiol:disulfide interchange protein DsbD
MGLIFLVLGTFSAYLTRLPRAGAWMEKIKIVFGIALLMTAAYYSRPLWVNKWESGNSDSITATTLQTSSKMNWQNYSPSLVNEAKSLGRPVIIDFWAQWCEACHELDKKTYSDSAVISATKDHVLLKLDATEVTDEIEAVFKKYQVLGLPTVIFINSKGEVLPSLTLTGFEGPVDFLKRLGRGERINLK